MGLKLENQYNPIYTEDKIAKEEDDSYRDDEKVEKNSPKKEKSHKPLFSAFKDDRVKSVVGIALLLFSALLLISSISYIENGADDQSLVDSKGIIENAKDNGIKNDGGPFGAAVSELLFNQGFGIGSFFLIYLIIVTGLKLLGKYKSRMISTFVICLTATITVSSIAGLSTLGYNSFFLLGGSHGRYFNELLISLIGIYGTIFVNILLLCILVALCINSLKKIYSNYSEFRKRRKASQLEAERREAEEAENSYNSVPESKYNESDYKPKIDENTDSIETSELKDADDVFNNNGVAKKRTDPQQMMVDTPNDDVKIEIEHPAEIEKADVIAQKPFDPTSELSKYKFPPSSLLREVKNNTISVDMPSKKKTRRG